MQIEVKWKCDRCGSEVFTKARLSTFDDKAMLRASLPLGWSYKGDAILCDECVERFKKFMRREI